MKYLKQMAIILTVSFLGEILKTVLPFPIPASIYGLLLMFGGLCLKIIPLETVKDTGKFLVGIMTLMFIPPTVGITQSWNRIQGIVVPLLVIIVVSTLAVIVVSGWVTQTVIRWEGKKEK